MKLALGQVRPLIGKAVVSLVVAARKRARGSKLARGSGMAQYTPHMTNVFQTKHRAHFLGQKRKILFAVRARAAIR